MESQYPKKTVAELIDRYIWDMDGIDGRRGLKPLSQSHRYNLRLQQRGMLGAKLAKDITDDDVLEYCRGRRETVCAATINQDLTFLRGVIKHARSAYKDCKDVNDTQIKDSIPLLRKYHLIGKSEPRKRIPSKGEEDQLLAHFAEYAKRKRVKTNVVPVILFALASTRRLSEICRLERGDINWETRMYMIRDVKHPTKKMGNHKWFPLLDPLPEIIAMMPQLTNDPHERVFPFVAHTVSYLYWKAKKALGIQNLRFHDNRRAAITRWLAVFKSPHKVKLISGHETTQILERVYDATDPATLHDEFAKIKADIQRLTA